MGLSSDPKARQRQLDGLKRGRRTLAKRWLDARAEPGLSTGKARASSPGRAPSKPGHSPGTKPGQAKTKARAAARTMNYDDEGKKDGRRRTAKAAAEPAEPERRGGLRAFFDGFVNG